MTEDSTTSDGSSHREPRDRGSALARHLSSLLVLAVPGYIVLAYVGYYLDLYPYSMILLVFALLMGGTIALAFTVMHVFTGD